jgi:GcrA cell cycle regulator
MIPRSLIDLKGLGGDVERLWREGVSARDIADQLGHGLTKGMVIGFVRRERLTFLPRPGVAPRRERAAAPPPAAAVSAGPAEAQVVREVGDAEIATIDAAHDAPASERPIVVEDAQAPVPQITARLFGPVETHALERRHCRWPLGDPRDRDFRYCGGKRLSGFPYCAEHVRLGYGAASTRLHPMAAWEG